MDRIQKADPPKYNKAPALLLPPCIQTITGLRLVGDAFVGVHTFKYKQSSSCLFVIELRCGQQFLS
jgi:hypothetical protein